MGFDRRNSKGTAVPAIHLTEPTSVVDSAVKSFTPQGATAAPLPNEAAVVSSIVQAMRLQMRDGVGTAVVHLEPDYLGAVSIALRVENGVVTASLHAENPQVRAWMEANESQLRDGLAGQGLSLDRLLVTDERIGDERSPNRRHQQEQEQQARQRPRRDDATTFEVVV
jgi:flagellar hook-length control protein FliK